MCVFKLVRVREAEFTFPSPLANLSSYHHTPTPMPLSQETKRAVEEVVDALCALQAPGRRPRQLAEMFLDLPSREDWPDYYQVSPRLSRVATDFIMSNSFAGYPGAEMCQCNQKQSGEREIQGCRGRIRRPDSCDVECRVLQRGGKPDSPRCWNSEGTSSS